MFGYPNKQKNEALLAQQFFLPQEDMAWRLPVFIVAFYIFKWYEYSMI